MSYSFKRERPVLDYIADFMCTELLLIVEVDGVTHDDPDKYQRDLVRDQRHLEVGFTVVRYSSWEVVHQLDWVYEDLVKVIDRIVMGE